MPQGPHVGSTASHGLSIGHRERFQESEPAQPLTSHLACMVVAAYSMGSILPSVIQPPTTPALFWDPAGNETRPTWEGSGPSPNTPPHTTATPSLSPPSPETRLRKLKQSRSVLLGEKESWVAEPSQAGQSPQAKPRLSSASTASRPCPYPQWEVTNEPEEVEGGVSNRWH